MGLMGNSWDDTKNTKLKLTRRGWISLGIVVVGFVFTGIKTYKTQVENDNLKEQKEKIRTFAYGKIGMDCLTILRPLTQIYLENSERSNRQINDHLLMYKEMVSESGVAVFKSINFLDSVKSGTAFEEWDKTYVDYVHGFYNSKWPYNLERTMTQWASYIDMEDLILIDSIMNHPYWIFLKNINYGHSEEERKEYIEEVGIYYLSHDDDILQEQNEFIELVNKLAVKTEKTHPTTKNNVH